MNRRIATAAINAVTAPGFEDEDGWCQRFVKQVVQSLTPKYDAFWGGSAKSTAHNFLESGVGKRWLDGMKAEPGDILYRTVGSGGFGHVGIYVGGPDRVAENSVYHWDQSGEESARGFRHFPGNWGACNVLVRLAADKRLILALKSDGPDGEWGYVAIESAELINGSFYVQSREIAQLFGVQVKGGIATIRFVLDAIKVRVLKVSNKLGDTDNPRMYLFVDKA